MGLLRKIINVLYAVDPRKNAKVKATRLMARGCLITVIKRITLEDGFVTNATEDLGLLKIPSQPYTEQ